MDVFFLSLDPKRPEIVLRLKKTFSFKFSFKPSLRGGRNVHSPDRILYLSDILLNSFKITWSWEKKFKCISLYKCVWAVLCHVLRLTCVTPGFWYIKNKKVNIPPHLIPSCSTSSVCISFVVTQKRVFLSMCKLMLYVQLGLGVLGNDMFFSHFFIMIIFIIIYTTIKNVKMWSKCILLALIQNVSQTCGIAF